MEKSVNVTSNGISEMFICYILLCPRYRQYSLYLGNLVKVSVKWSFLGSDHVHKFLLCQYRDAELLRLCQLAACLLAADQVIRLFGDGTAGRGGCYALYFFEKWSVKVI